MKPYCLGPRMSVAFSPEVVDRIKKRHREMRSLIGKLTGVSFEEDPDKVVSMAGKACARLQSSSTI